MQAKQKMLKLLIFKVLSRYTVPRIDYFQDVRYPCDRYKLDELNGSLFKVCNQNYGMFVIKKRNIFIC